MEGCPTASLHSLLILIGVDKNLKYASHKVHGRFDEVIGFSRVYFTMVEGNINPISVRARIRSIGTYRFYRLLPNQENNAQVCGS